MSNATADTLLASTRRHFLGRGAGISLGAAALDGLIGSSIRGEPMAPPRQGRAKRVIFLTQSGGPSQLELFDHKPDLVKQAGTELPASVRMGQRLTGMTANQAPAMTFLQTGHQLPGRPSIGAWVSYGLGSPSRNLPDFVVLVSKMQRPSDQPLYDYYWGSGFLPGRYQGARFRNASEPVLYLQDPDGLPLAVRKGSLDGLSELNRMRAAQTGDPETLTRVRQYEMAYRMQSSVPELTDLSAEPAETFELYGPDSRRPGSYAANCVLARRLAERGVRFIQLFHPDWDHHSRLPSWCVARCRDTDQATAGLITDLKRRGLLDDTLVVWGGEFGRSPVGQGDWKSIEAGRDHHPRCFTMWMAGGGVKAGHTHGSTDDFSYNVARDPVSVHDLQATIMHLLGIDHTRLTYRFQGRDFRLTDVHGSVVNGVLA